MTVRIHADYFKTFIIISKYHFQADHHKADSTNSHPTLDQFSIQSFLFCYQDFGYGSKGFLLCHEIRYTIEFEQHVFHQLFYRGRESSCGRFHV